jgi:hypothetical protein
MLEQNGTPSSQPNNVPYSNPLNTYGTSIVQLTNPESELYKLELVLRGSRLDQYGRPVYNPDGTLAGEPLMNELGINRVLGLVQSLVNQNTVFGNLTKVQTDGLRNMFADALVKELMPSMRKYNIKGGGARRIIFAAALMYAVPTLSRGEEGDEKRFLSKSVQEIRSSIDSPQKRSSFLGNVLGWGKN